MISSEMAIRLIEEGVIVPPDIWEEVDDLGHRVTRYKTPDLARLFKEIESRGYDWEMEYRSGRYGIDICKDKVPGIYFEAEIIEDVVADALLWVVEEESAPDGQD